ncbi:sigma 54-interacting transcriptional regulator [Amaricoccus sp.]|uniref:sigma 54-interacting transcriptional regulator n=1 Tax=Amaricoccus sp. TaxID=1872485 RepID=UPI0026126C0B|nr:sigma 54-interacting transcriptional regulator [Amaricoccus sp.]HRO11153.1 sigma 54-interacting transcriptional regulator [Amaricoccus sp.]
MRFDILFADRVGIASEILSVIARRRVNVVGVEVEVPHVYVDAPDYPDRDLAALAADLATVAGVETVRTVDLLPGERRRMQLHALLDALGGPVMALDGAGTILVANQAAASAAGRADLAGVRLATLVDAPDAVAELVEGGFGLPPREVTLKGRPYMLETHPVDPADGAAGGVVLLHAPQRLGERLNALQGAETGGFEAILGESPPMRALKARGARVAAVDAPLLILGETGTGKELLARACHAASPRAERPFLALNCAALPESLAESELFGYAGGAFSGARREGKPGLLELADRGTVFLDEVGEMSLYLQAKLLRFLNDGSFRRVGGEREARVNVRIISATHRDLPGMITRGEFREDLFYRLNVLSLTLPPLRERGEDIRLLARHFVARAAAQARRSDCRLASDAERALMAAPWPGNARQLENVIFRAVTLSDHGLLTEADLGLAASAAGRRGAADGEVTTWAEALAGFERDLLARLYPSYPSSRRLAARLGASHTMIANKLRRHRLPEGAGKG